ncbi:MAG TPA: aldo/keto reductase, partial [Acidimicrobiales bacterium]|nr:aldo/keto reductase [Acidimicrobiales bacterium]
IAGKGREAGADGAHPGELLSIARAHRATPAQIRLAWTLGLGGHVLAIPGTGNPAHLEENVAAGAIDLTPDEMDRLGGLQSP